MGIYGYESMPRVVGTNSTPLADDLSRAGQGNVGKPRF